MLRLPIAAAVIFVLIGVTPAHAQGVATADDKELAAYTLTMPTLKKVVAAMRAMVEEMAQDPRYQRMMKLEDEIDAVEKELEKLQSKDELTKAEEARIETLDAQLEKLNAEKEQQEEKLEAENPMRNPETLSDMERGIRAFPPMARALAREGLSPREYSKFMLAMMQAGMVYGFSQGKVDYAKLPAGVNPANVKFVAEHKAELDAMQKEFEALGKRRRK